MAYWSIYVSPNEEKSLKKTIQKIAEKHRWSFSQAVTGLLREHLIEKKNSLSDNETWNLMSSQSFFEGYPEEDGIYDAL